MKPILVTTDFSGASRNAANYAADMAVFLKTDIILLHVIELPPNAFPVPIAAFEIGEIERNAHESMEKLWQELLARTGNKIKLYPEIQFGNAVFEICKFARDKQPFAVVAGLKSDSTTERFFVGSNTMRLVRQTTFPLLIIPENVSFRQIESIAIASDLTCNENDASMLFIKEWLHAFNVSPKVIHVKKADGTVGGSDEGIKYLQKNLSGFSPKFYFINEKEVAGGIGTFVSEFESDLLIVVPENHGLLESVFKKSISRQIILQTQLPVLSLFSSTRHTKHNTGNKVAEKSGHNHSCKCCDGNCAGKKELKKMTKLIGPGDNR